MTNNNSNSSPLPTPRKLRQYEPIWIRLKERGYARVACLPKDQRRIRKAVWKEKDADAGFKMESELAGKSQRRLTCTMHPTYVEFRLTVTKSKLDAGDL